MATMLEILASALAGALISIIVREIFAWKFTELENKKIHVEKLLEKIYGEIYVIMDHLKWPSGHYRISSDEYNLLFKIASLFEYEFDPEYYSLLDDVLVRIKTALDNNPKDFLVTIETIKPGIIADLIDETKKIHTNLVKQHQILQNMRKGIWKNFKFIFFTWRL